MEYHLYENGTHKRDAKARNGLWIRVLEQIPAFQETSNKCEELESACEVKTIIRQKIPVNHLFLSHSKPTAQSRKFIEPPIVIDGDSGPLIPRTFLAIITTEITSLGVSAAVAAIWRSAWMVLWLVPLFLKLIAGFHDFHYAPRMYFGKQMCPVGLLSIYR